MNYGQLLKNPIFTFLLALIIGFIVGTIMATEREHKISTEKITQLTKDHQAEIATAIETERKKQVEALTSNKEVEIRYVDRVVKVVSKDGTTTETVIKDKIIDNKDSTTSKKTQEDVKQQVKIVEKIVDHVVEKVVEKRVEIFPAQPRFSVGAEVTTPLLATSKLMDLYGYKPTKDTASLLGGIRVVDDLWLTVKYNVDNKVQLGIKYELRF